MVKEITGLNPFSKICHVYTDHYDFNSQTVLPENVNKVYLSLKGDFKNRCIIVYMQPHPPFVGKESVKSKGWTQWTGQNYEGKIVWDLVKDGELTLEAAVKGYKSNLEYVLEYVKKLLPELNGKIIISSDHGELFGEYDEYGHPGGVYYRELLEVPYLEIM